MELFLILLAFYAIALIWISWRAKRNETEEGFLIADRKRSWWQVGFSKYAASVGAGWFIVYSGFAYEFGWPVALVFIGAIVGVLLYAYWATPRIRVPEAAKAYTQGDYVEARTDSTTAKLFLNFAVILLAFVALLTAVVGGAALLDTYGLMSYEAAVAFIVLITVGYILLSGFRAVMLTDVLQGVMLLGLVTVVIVGLLTVQPVTLEILTESRNISILGTAMLMVFGVVSVFADPTRFQVTYAGASSRAVTKGMLFSIAPLLFTAWVLFLLGNSVYLLDANLASADVFPTALATYLPELLVPFGFLVFFVAVMSTADSYLYAIASHTAQFLSKASLRQLIIRMLIGGYGLILMVVALVFRDVVDLGVLTGAIIMVISVPMLYLIAGGQNGMRFVVLLASGFIGAFTGILVLGLIPDSGIFVLAAFLLSLLVPVKRLERWLG